MGLNLRPLVFVFGESQELRQALIEATGASHGTLLFYEDFIHAARALGVDDTDLPTFESNLRILTENNQHLGVIALKNYKDLLDNSPAPMIFYGCQQIQDVMPFVVEFGGDNITIIEIGVMRPVRISGSVEFIHVAQMEAHRQMLALEAELTKGGFK